MKDVRKSLRLILFLIITVALIVTMASCKKKNKNHEHDYVATVTPATCTAKGYTTYTCECGESYTGDEVAEKHNYASLGDKAPTCTEEGYTDYLECTVCGHVTKNVVGAKGHNYEETITKQPTFISTGILTKVCKDCGDTKETVLEVVTVSLPKVSEALKSFVGANTVKVNTDDIELIMVKEINDGTVTQYEKNYLAIELAHIEIDGKRDELYARFSLNLGVATYDTREKDAQPTFENKLLVDVIVDGEDVSVAITDKGESENVSFQLSEALYNVLAENLNMSYEEFSRMIYIGGGVVSYLPMAEGILDYISSVKLPEGDVDVSVMAPVLGEDVIVAEGNTYKLDLSALVEFFEAVQDKSIAEIIDDKFGAGTVDEIKSFLISMPTTQVRDIADYAVQISEQCGFAIDDVYALINLVISDAIGEAFDIEDMIETRYDRTVAEIIAELTYGEGEATEDEINEIASELVDHIRHSVTIAVSYSVDQLYNYLMFGNPDYTTSDGEVFSIADSFIELVDVLGDKVKAELTVDADGFVESADLEIDGVRVNYNSDSDLNKYTLKVFLEYGEVITFDLSEEGAKLLVTDTLDDGTSETLAEGVITYEEKDGAENYLASIKFMNDEYLKTDLSILNGEIVSAELVVNSMVYGAIKDMEGDEHLLTVLKVILERGDTNTLSVVMNGLYMYEEYFYDTVSGVYYYSTVREFENVLDAYVFYGENSFSATVNGTQIFIEKSDVDGNVMYEATIGEDEDIASLVVRHSDNDNEASLTYNDYLLFKAATELADGELTSLEVIINTLIYGEVDGFEGDEHCFNLLTVTFEKTGVDLFDGTLIVNSINTYEKCYEGYDGEEYYHYHETVREYLNLTSIHGSYSNEKISVSIDDVDFVLDITELVGCEDYTLTITDGKESVTVTAKYDETEHKLLVNNNEYEIFKAVAKLSDGEITSLELVLNELVTEKLEGFEGEENLVNLITMYFGREGDSFDVTLVLNELAYQFREWYDEATGEPRCADVLVYKNVANLSLSYYDGIGSVDLKLDELEYIFTRTELVGGEEYTLTITDGKDFAKYTAKYDDTEHKFLVSSNDRDLFLVAAKLIDGKIDSFEFDWNQIYYGEIEGFDGDEHYFDLINVTFDKGDDGAFDVSTSFDIINITTECKEGWIDGEYYHDHKEIVSYENELDFSASYSKDKISASANEIDLILDITELEGGEEYTLTVTENEDTWTVTARYDDTEHKLLVNYNEYEMFKAAAQLNDTEITYLELIVNTLYTTTIINNGVIVEKEEKFFNMLTFIFEDKEGDACDVSFILNQLVQDEVVGLEGDEHLLNVCTFIFKSKGEGAYELLLKTYDIYTSEYYRYDEVSDWYYIEYETNYVNTSDFDFSYDNGELVLINADQTYTVTVTETELGKTYSLSCLVADKDSGEKELCAKLELSYTYDADKISVYYFDGWYEYKAEYEYDSSVLVSFDIVEDLDEVLSADITLSENEGIYSLVYSFLCDAVEDITSNGSIKVEVN